MRWLYRLQRRLALTRAESTAVILLSALLLAGLAARHFRTPRKPLPPDPSFATDYEQLRQGAAFLRDARATAASSEEPFGAPPLNINRASAEELEALPRIGPRIAAAIVAYRKEHGAFRTSRDLIRVRGIGPKTMETLMPYVTVDSLP